MQKTDEHYRTWQRLAPLGLLLVGVGTSVVADAAIRKSHSSHVLTWVAEGTVGLVALNAVLSIFGEAVKRRALYDIAIGR
jgi:hypothetical protein